MDPRSVQPRPWPPAYTLKKHPRAKRIRFRASLRRGLEIIVPTYFNLKQLPALLDQNRAWIEAQLLAFDSQPQEEGLPRELNFQALNARWKLEYVPSAGRLQLISRPNQELVLLGKVQNQAACKRKLISWIKAFAKEQLLSYLQKLSLETGLTYSKAAVRAQLTRWGSCTRNGRISLNYRLIFMPQALVKHTLLHELCHTVHFNHSPKFWSLLAHYDPDWYMNRRVLRKSEQWIPPWLI